MRTAEQEREASQQSEERGVLRRLGGSLAHHVNNALTGVLGHLELALQYAEPHSPLEEHLRASLECAYRAAETVRRIVRFSGRGVLAEEPLVFSLRHLAEELVGRLHAAAPEVQVELVPGDVAPVRGCPSLLAHAIESVLTNALEATPPGEAVTVLVREEDGFCALSVRDGGPGLSPAARARLFEPFWTNKPSPHLGLGLAMAREALESQGGTLQIDSVPGQGVTATFRLPAAPAAELPTTPTRESLSVPLSYPLVPARVLAAG